MTYSIQLVIPPSTPSSSPFVSEVKVPPGILRRIRVTHPTGCADLVGVAIYYNSLRILPLGDTQWFLGNGVPIELDVEIPLLVQPLEVQLKGYNTDDTYTHRPIVVLHFEFEGSYAQQQRLLGSLFSSGLLEAR